MTLGRHDEHELRDAIQGYRAAAARLTKAAQDGSVATTVRECLRVRLAVLMIEDDPTWPELVERYLNANGFRASVRRVESYDGIAMALQDETPDVILCDHSMPGLDSMGALEFVRSVAPGMPFLVLSGTLPESDGATVMDLGASDFIQKSSLDRLAPAIRRELARSA